MRIPEPQEDLVGKICVCSIGRPAIVVGRKPCQFGAKQEMVMCWIGLGLDGKGTWASANPCIIAETGMEFRDKLSERFGGKMSYNS